MSLNDAKDLFFEFIKDVNIQQYKFLYGFYKKMDKKGKIGFIRDILNEGIFIHQPPFWGNVDIDQLGYIYNKYEIQPERIFWNGVEVEKRFIIADEYLLKLKHKSASKFSARSSGFVNSKNMPSKSMSFKKREKLYSTTSIRVGEMEITNLNLCLNPDLISKFIKYYSSSKRGREILVKKLVTSNPLKPLDLEDLNDNNNREILDQYLKSIGLEIE